MGLDNGVKIVFHMDKIKGYQRLPEEIFRLAEDVYCRSNKYNPEKKDWVFVESTLDCELVYWRKWWGVRNEVMLRLGTGDDPYQINLTEDNINDIIDVLQYFRNKERWEYEGQSIWDYEDNNIEDQIDVDIYVLESLIKIMRKEKDLIDNGIMEVYFYDSY